MRTRAAAFTLAMCLLGASHARADDDPEPPGKGGALLRELKGKWAVVRSVANGREGKGVRVTYEFDGDKLILDNGRAKAVFKVRVDARQKPAVLERTADGKKTVTQFFKIDKGELYLAGDLGEGKADKDFSGKSGSIVVMKREKK
jgi:uncharacterized protein (TIGR03067 family)